LLRVRTSDNPSITHSNSRPEPLARLPELDGVRGIAALIVFFHHLCFTTINGQAWGSGVRWLSSIFSFGTIGVDIFFVLSGFLITSLLIRDRESPAFYRDFYWKRALRILPLYFVCLIGVLFFIPHSRAYVLLAALFVANFTNLLHIEAVGPFWSLAIEEHFYLIWPTVVRRRNISQLRNWSLAIIGIVVLLRGVAALVGHHNYHLTPLRADGIAAGALLASIFERSRRDALNATVYTPVLLMVFIAGFVIFRVPGLFSLEPLASGAFFYQFAATLMCTGAVGLVIAHAGNRYLRFLRSQLLTFFGLISYAFYMIHFYVMMVYDKFFPLTAGDTRSYVVRLGGMFVITIALCLLSRYLIELPVLSLRKHVLKQPAPAAEMQAPLSAHYDESQKEVVT
jgi:peptidoglycan/LPS O-acetylase OafA/YrhL